jgi:uncharacterized protein
MMDTARQTAAAPFHAMTKPVGPACNLACSYCFYLEKSQLFRGAGNFRMSDETLEAYIRDYIAAQPGTEVHFAWQGGEPTLLGIDFFREVVALQERFCAGRAIRNAFQTNGILLDAEWAEFFARHKFLVGVSIDGPRELHDAYRVDRGGQPTFDRVMAGLDVLRARGVEFNTLTTVNRKNARHPGEVYRFLKKVGSGYIQFIPIVERDAPPGGSETGLHLAPPPDHPDGAGSAVTPWSVRPADYGEFLCRIFDEWLREDVGKVFVQQFDAALANWAGEPPGVCVFSKNCGRTVAVEHNGDVYSCDHYVYPEYCLGSLLDKPLASMVDSPAQDRFGEAKSAALPRCCLECPVEFACHGECPKHRFLRTPEGEPSMNYLCAAYRRFFAHIDSAMRTMAALLQSAQPPSAIMQIPRKDWIRAGNR